jgi:uncharacterized membrane protein YidH (DUF202 family)
MPPMSAPMQPERRTDATRRTHLANERTYLAWLRTGMAAVAVGLAIAKLLPPLDGGATWAYVGIGVGFCLLGIGLLYLGIVRFRDVTKALKRGEFGPFDERSALWLGGLAILLSVATIALVLFEP